MQNNEHLEYVKQELEYNNLIKCDMGKSILQLFENAWEMSLSNKLIVDNIVQMVDRLNKKLPLLPLQESEMHYVKAVNGPDQLRHSRYFPVFQAEDGKYYDDQAIAYVSRLDGSFTYFYSANSDKNSRIEIQFPYYPTPTYLWLEEDEITKEMNNIWDASNNVETTTRST